MSDQSPKFSLAVPESSLEDEYETARILMREGLLEEAKKTLFKIIARHQKVDVARALLKEIETRELDSLFNETRSSEKNEALPEDSNELIAALDRDLGLRLGEQAREIGEVEKWKDLNHLSLQAYVDLGIGYYEMGCFGDAFREFTKAYHQIRQSQSVLGEMGLLSASMIAHCLTELGKPYDAKIFLDPILLEPEIRHEDKIVLYYAMGLIEEMLGNEEMSSAWLKKTLEIDPDFKDASYRLRQK